MAQLKILSVASECVPWAKTGGLADVVGALPKSISADMRVLMPAYPSIDLQGRTLWRDPDLFGGPARIVASKRDGLSLLLLDAPHLFDRQGGLYGDGADWPDNPLRFAALSWAGAQVAAGQLSSGWTPQIVHAHDWQAGLTPAYLKLLDIPVKSVLTIHNIAFQGLASRDQLAALRLPEQAYTPQGVEYYGLISTLKAGMVYADAITTVSPQYALELRSAEFGMGLEGLVQARAQDMHGILNGIDTQLWDPQNAEFAYSAASLHKKKRAREALMAECGLRGEGPLAIIVSRLTPQKGIDLLAHALPDFFEAGGMLAVLGSGEPSLQQALQQLAAQYPTQMSLRLGYDEAWSQRLFAGGDAVLVPSRFEPCGLTQLYGLRFGTVPVVARTGGLADTVVHANHAALSTGAATGIVHEHSSGDALREALLQLSALYRDQPTWKAMQSRGMRQDLGWKASSEQYLSLYRQLLRSQTL